MAGVGGCLEAEPTSQLIGFDGDRLKETIMQNTVGDALAYVVKLQYKHLDDALLSRAPAAILGACLMACQQV